MSYFSQNITIVKSMNARGFVRVFVCAYKRFCLNNSISALLQSGSEIKTLFEAPTKGVDKT